MPFFVLFSSISNRLIPILDITGTVQDHSIPVNFLERVILMINSFVLQFQNEVRTRSRNYFSSYIQVLVIGWSQCLILGILSKITQAESGRNQAGENTPVQKNLGNGSLLRLSISSEKNPPGRRFSLNFSWSYQF